MKLPQYDIGLYIEEVFGKKIEITDFANFIRKYIERYKKGHLNFDDYIMEYLGICENQ